MSLTRTLMRILGASPQLGRLAQSSWRDSSVNSRRNSFSVVFGDERDLKCLKTPLRSGLAGLALASQRVPVASEAAPREAGLAAQAFRGSAQAPSEPLVDGLSWHRGYPLRTNLNKPSVL